MRGRQLGACAIAAIAVVAIAVGHPAPAAADDPAALLVAAGVGRHLEEWPEANVLVRERAEASLEPEAFALLMREVATAFAAPALLERVVSRLGVSVAHPSFASLRDGYAQSGSAGLLGPADGFTAGDLRDFPRFASAVSRRELDPTRITIVARIDEATGFGRNAWRATAAWGAAIERGARALRCEGRAAWEAPLPSEVTAERQHLAEPFRERVHLELLFATRERALDDLRRSAEFLETPPVRAFHAALAKAVVAALADAQEELRARLGDVVAQQCAAGGGSATGAPDGAAGG